MHGNVDLDALGLDPERSAVLKEIFALFGQVHDEALTIAGPVPYPTELTMQQLRVLGIIAKDPGMAGNEVGHRLAVSAPTASGLIDRLVEKGLLSRSDDPADRRIRRLHLTDDGRDVMRQSDSLVERAMVKVIKMMTMEDLQTMKHSSQVFLDAMYRARAAGIDSD